MALFYQSADETQTGLQLRTQAVSNDERQHIKHLFAPAALLVGWW
jgi:hypothetical protein